MTTPIVCNLTADYSNVTGERILPFVFTLNTEGSILEPEEGQLQRFCYDINGVGEDTSAFADLSHFLLGICNEITFDAIEEITVTINGEPQAVIRGENVEIKTEERPDPPTGCVGLKFDFPLDKVDGEMQVCFTMNSVFAVGPVNVCVFGGNVTAAGLTICGPVCGKVPTSCESVFFQTETVCVPVTVTPFATAGEATASCCGEPVISTEPSCPGSRTSCTFTITQRLCIRVPISFGAVIETGEARVQCGGVSEEPCDCTDATEETMAPVIEPTPVNHNIPQNNLNSRRFFNRS